MRFGKPKTPGYGISRDYYLTVLAGTASLPALQDVVNPEGSRGAVVGFGVPLAPEAKHDDLSQPLRRGAYGFATKDRKTVLRAMVLSKEEAGFDPRAILESPLTVEWDQELRNRLSAAWSLVQLMVESFHPEVDPTAEFMLAIAHRLAESTDGAIADPLAGAYRLPYDVRRRTGRLVDDALLHVSVAAERGSVVTLGLAKFGLSELRMSEVPESLQGAARAFLTTILRKSFGGEPLRVGASTPCGPCMLRAVAGNGSIELVPHGGGPLADCLGGWSHGGKPI